MMMTFRVGHQWRKDSKMCGKERWKQEKNNVLEEEPIIHKSSLSNIHSEQDSFHSVTDTYCCCNKLPHLVAKNKTNLLSCHSGGQNF